jgi:hypothetical protein
MTIERRKYVRFLAKDNSFAALRNGFKKVGKIDDVSINGLGFSYLSEITEVDTAGHFSKVDIFLSGNGFHLFNVPCRIVYEIPDSTPDEGFLVRMSNCGLQFGELTRSQLEQLELFIKNHTIEILSS